MIENAVNNLIKRKNQLNQSDAEFNQGVKDALNKLRTSVIEEVAREYNEYEYYGTAKPSISPSTVLKVKEKICPLFPFC